MWRGAMREEGRKEEEERERERGRKWTQMREGREGLRDFLISKMRAWLLETVSFWSSWLLDFQGFKGQIAAACSWSITVRRSPWSPDQLSWSLDSTLTQVTNTLTQGTLVTNPCCVKQNRGAMKRMRTQSIPSFFRVVFFGSQLMWSSSRVTTHNLPETRKVSLKVKSVLDARWNEGICLSPWLSPVGLRSRTVVLLSNTPWIPEVSVANGWLLLASRVGTVESLTSRVGIVESLTSRVGIVESLTLRVGIVESQASSVGIVPFNRSPSSKVSKRGFDFT